MDNEIFLLKVAEFTKLAVEELHDLEDRVSLLTKKEAQLKRAEANRVSKLEKVVKEAANALYDSDFITDDQERREFLKLAKEDPSYLAETLIKVCRAADVSLLGSPSKVTVKRSMDERDPVMVRAFGFNGFNTIFDSE